MIRSAGRTGHNCLNDNQVKILIKGQELKKKVETNIAQTVQELFKVAQDELSADKVPDNVVAADFTSLLHQSSGLHKRRAKTLPSVPKNFVELDITGQFALTTGGMPFLRYDNKSENNRIILLVCDKTLKILGDSKDWYMDGTFKCAPEQLLQMYSLHGRLDGNFLPSEETLIQPTIQTILSQENMPRRNMFDSLPANWLNTSVAEFNFVRRQGNWDAIEENSRKKKENEDKEKAINLRIAGIILNQIEVEVARLFAEIEKATGNKRKRVSKNTRDEAINNIRKKIRLEVSNEFDRIFFEKYAEPGLFREIVENERSQEDFIDALSSARQLLNN